MITSALEATAGRNRNSSTKSPCLFVCLFVVCLYEGNRRSVVGVSVSCCRRGGGRVCLPEVRLSFNRDEEDIRSTPQHLC